MRMAKSITCAALMLLIACAPSMAAVPVSFDLTCTSGSGSYAYTLTNTSTTSSVITLLELGIWGDDAEHITTITGSASGWAALDSPPEDYWWVSWESEDNTPGIGDPPVSGFGIETNAASCPMHFEVTYYLDDSWDLCYFTGEAQCGTEPAVPEPSAIVSMLSLVTGLGALKLRRRA